MPLCHFKLVSYFNSLVQILGLQKVYTSGFHDYVSQYFPIFLYLCTNCDYMFFLKKIQTGYSKIQKMRYIKIQNLGFYKLKNALVLWSCILMFILNLKLHIKVEFEAPNFEIWLSTVFY